MNEINTTYANLAWSVYNVNERPVPAGWGVLSITDINGKETLVKSDPDSGFLADVFSNGSEIVITFAGTNGDNDFVDANIPLGVGASADQLNRAIDMYYAVKEEYGENINISFAGHSLAGGLASIMGIWFDKDAHIYDPAPFKNTVESYTTWLAARQYMISKEYPLA